MAANRGQNTVMYLVIGGAAVLLIALLILYPGGNNWTETLRTNAEEPYDLSVFQALLDSSTSKPLVVSEDPVTEELSKYYGYNYFFLGSRAILDSADISALFEFAERGNAVFLCTPDIPQTFFDECDNRYLWLGASRTTWSGSARSQVTKYGGEHEFDYIGPFGYSTKWWSYIEPDPENEEEPEKETALEDLFPDNFESDTSEIAIEPDSIVEVEEQKSYEEDEHEEWVDFEQLGGFYNQTQSDTLYGNFFRIDVGDGTIFVHCNPIMFSNYFLMQESGYAYANEVLSFLDNRPVIWDNFHQTYHYNPEDYQYEANTPLRFIFEHPALKYAWLTLVGSAFLFLIFRSKREQRVIPIIPPVENSSMAFARSLGVLYHQATSGRYLAIELMRMFDNFNRRQYQYNRNRKNEESAAEIAKKSRVPLPLVEEIITLERQTVYNPVSKLMQVFVLYNRLEEYYKQAKR